MHTKTWMILLIAALTLAVACESEIDGKAAAEVAEPTAEEAAPAQEEAAPAEEAKEVRELAFNTEASKIEWVGAKVTGDHTGGFQKWEGVGHVSGDATLEKVAFTVDTTSITSDDERLTGHLMSEDFFAVEKYPTATFESTKIEEGAEGDATHTVTGTMTMLEATKQITFPVTVKVENGTMVVDSEFTIKRFDFGIEYKGKADDLIRDEVLMKLHMELPLSAEAVAAEPAEEGSEG
ncbi:YceI family protein [Bradymonadaceae bacterium TMQ3]|uniref:YceI family protein n=1 Tax=Lujinxingia sediminis TaxID=2480984 RepID=A0ABY0CR69_9DELT|nr:YceI family protein [Lujinxingia sediminis]RDV37021.1 YceI family protein [Bradymonadaceae bacterium TMQ3]RVU42897.1 YceI family protein [Lujinxingia sediminis]TXC73146.1 YceI family protein [Bradymonadales bacterium TMQ1]